MLFVVGMFNILIILQERNILQNLSGNISSSDHSDQIGSSNTGSNAENYINNL
jgi:hypothetical protein